MTILSKVSGLLQNSMIETTSSQTVLSFNIQNIDNLFTGFIMGDFAIMHGTPSVLSLSLQLAVRAQLPFQLGGIESNTIYVDGGNTFRLYEVSRLARLNQLKPKHVLERILISRAFTVYQMTTLIFEKLEEAVKKYKSRFVILSDYEVLYFDKDIEPEESRELFIQTTTYLSKFAKENRVIILATCMPHCCTRRTVLLHAIACARSTVTIAIGKKSTYPHDKQFFLEKHPTYKLGTVDFPSENPTLKDFAGSLKTEMITESSILRSQSAS
jgi:hypothetical protein